MFARGGLRAQTDAQWKVLVSSRASPCALARASVLNCKIRARRRRGEHATCDGRCRRYLRKPVMARILELSGFWVSIVSRKFWDSANCAVRGPAASDHGVRATARAPSRTPLSQSASALLNVKVCNCGTEVHQNGASADTRLPSSILQQLVHLSFMLHACREWLYRQVSLLSGCLSRGSSTAARVLRQCRA